MNDKEIYDKKAVYDEEISPLVKRIMEIAEKHRIPVFMGFVYAFDGRDNTYTCSGADFQNRESNVIRACLSHFVQPGQPIWYEGRRR